jgi:hypothetical protein
MILENLKEGLIKILNLFIACFFYLILEVFLIYFLRKLNSYTHNNLLLRAKVALHCCISYSYFFTNITHCNTCNRVLKEHSTGFINNKRFSLVLHFVHITTIFTIVLAISSFKSLAIKVSVSLSQFNDTIFNIQCNMKEDENVMKVLRKFFVDSF